MSTRDALWLPDPMRSLRTVSDEHGVEVRRTINGPSHPPKKGAKGDQRLFVGEFSKQIEGAGLELVYFPFLGISIRPSSDSSRANLALRG